MARVTNAEGFNSVRRILEIVSKCIETKLTASKDLEGSSRGLERSRSVSKEFEGIWMDSRSVLKVFETYQEE